MLIGLKGPWTFEKKLLKVKDWDMSPINNSPLPNLAYDFGLAMSGQADDDLIYVYIRLACKMDSTPDGRVGRVRWLRVVNFDPERQDEGRCASATR